MKYLRPVLLGLAILVLLEAPQHLKPYGVYVLSTWAVTTIAAIGLNLMLGFAGQVSLAQAAFVGIGAYTTALMTTNGLPFFLAAPASGLLAFAVGWLLGYPALKVQHHYLAFVTLAFNTLVGLVFRNEEWLTHGIAGIAGVPRPHVLGWSTAPPRDYYYFCLVFLAMVGAAAWWLVRSPWGRAFVALRENPMRAQSLGVDTRRYTLLAFALGSGLGGIAGALYAPLVQFIDPTPFGLGFSLNLLLMVIVGGSGFLIGPFIGALVAVLLPEWLRFTEGLYLIIYAGLVITLLVFSPTGLVGLFQRIVAALRPAPARPVAPGEQVP